MFVFYYTWYSFSRIIMYFKTIFALFFSEPLSNDSGDHVDMATHLVGNDTLRTWKWSVPRPCYSAPSRDIYHYWYSNRRRRWWFHFGLTKTVKKYVSENFIAFSIDNYGAIHLLCWLPFIWIIMLAQPGLKVSTVSEICTFFRASLKHRWKQCKGRPSLPIWRRCHYFVKPLF